MFRGLLRYFTKENLTEYYERENLLIEYPKYALSKYIWHKEIDQYTIREIKYLDSNIEKLNFIHNNGISFIRETHEAIKDTRIHAMMLLGYLSTIMFASIGVAVQGGLTLQEPLEYIALSVALMSLLIIFPTSTLFYSQTVAYTYFQPDEFMEKNMFQHNLSLLKIHDIKTIQLMGCKNLEIANRMNKTLESCISWSLAMPMLIGIGIVVWKLWLWTAYNYASQL